MELEDHSFIGGSGWRRKIDRPVVPFLSLLTWSESLPPPPSRPVEMESMGGGGVEGRAKHPEVPINFCWRLYYKMLIALDECLQINSRPRSSSSAAVPVSVSISTPRRTRTRSVPRLMTTTDRPWDGRLISMLAIYSVRRAQRQLWAINFGNRNSKIQFNYNLKANIDFLQSTLCNGSY